MLYFNVLSIKDFYSDKINGSCGCFPKKVSVSPISPAAVDDRVGDFIPDNGNLFDPKTYSVPIGFLHITTYRLNGTSFIRYDF